MFGAAQIQPQQAGDAATALRERRAVGFAQVAGAIAFAFGLVALSGWFLGNDALKGAVGAPITMKSNTAVCLMLCGAALILDVPGARGARRTLALVFAAVVMAVGVLTLSQYAFQWNIGIDELLFREAPLSPATTSPNRMGMPASTSFTLLGLALLLRNWPARPRQLCHWLGLITAAISLVPVAGYAYEARMLYSSAQITGIAWPTALALLLLSLGLIAGRPREGFMAILCANDLGGVVVRRLLVPKIAAPFVLGGLILILSTERGFSTSFTVALLAVLLILFATLFLMYQGAQLGRAGRGRAEAESRLRAQLERTRLAESALRESEQRRRLALDATRVGYWELRPGDGSVQASELFRLHFALASNRDVRMDELTEKIHPDDREHWKSAVEQAVATGGAFELELRVPAQSGERWVLVRASCVNEPNRPISLCGVSIDATERKAAEKERLDLLDRERAARSEAERHGRVKDEFLATLSHEMRTPLNAILGWTHLLRRRENLSGEVGEGLAVIDKNARAQAQLVSDLLDMSRIVSGKMRLDVQPVSLPDVIAGALESIRPAAEAKGVRIEKVIEPLIQAVNGDAARMQQVVWNLLSNAVKFTPRGGKVQVVLSRVNSHVEIQVSDTGKGIKPELLPHVFERFRQGDSSAAREHGGLGIGLSLVRQLVEMHGGTVEAASPGDGRGACFTVKLPLAVAARSSPDRVHPVAAASSDLHLNISLDGLRVLVVDDEADARDFVRRLFEEARARVTTAGGAAEALLALSTGDYDVLVSDLGMPGQDGYELISAVRQRGWRLPAAALTAFARSEDRSRSLLAGYQAHLAKPVEPLELLATVASLGTRARQVRPPDRAARSPDA